jgi:hypothetical protein
MLDSHRFTRAVGMLAVCATLFEAAPIDAQPDRDGNAAVPAPVRTLLTRLPADPDGWRPEGMEGAVAMQMFPLAGREDLVARFAPGAFRHASCPPLAGEPLAELAAAARDAQIVIVNEAHDQPLHRWVIREIGLALTNRFDTFAAETFSHKALAERMPGRITDALGSYSDEPVFGRELRALDGVGYDFVAYEIRADQRAPEGAGRAEQVVTREEAQAENLIAAALADDPEARILVHVGYSHALETPVNNFEREIEWFAARLKRKTGIDPLTISQTHCSLDEEGGNAWDGLRLADGSGAVEREGAIDRFLAHPPLQFEAGRPAWRRAIGDVEVPVPEALRSDDQRVIVEARAPQDAIDEVPVDRLLLYPGESLPLLLPPGRWRLTAWTRDGALGDSVTVEAAL